jgi:hypothetical protein
MVAVNNNIKKTKEVGMKLKKLPPNFLNKKILKNIIEI